LTFSSTLMYNTYVSLVMCLAPSVWLGIASSSDYAGF